MRKPWVRRGSDARHDGSKAPTAVARRTTTAGLRIMTHGSAHAESAIGRADLLRVLVVHGEEGLDALAAALGYERTPAQRDKKVDLTGEAIRVVPGHGVSPMPARSCTT